jgi:hypothetical protein
MTPTACDRELIPFGSLCPDSGFVQHGVTAWRLDFWLGRSRMHSFD